MLDILGNNGLVHPKGSIVTMEQFLLTLGGGESGANLLCSQVQIQYQQQSTLVPTVGSCDVYLVSGFPQGTLSLGYFVGSQGFFSFLGSNQCGLISNVSLTLSNGCCSTLNITAKGSIKIQNLVVRSLGIQVQGQGATPINQSVEIMFLYMSL